MPGVSFQTGTQAQLSVATDSRGIRGGRMRASLAAGALFAINSKCLNLGGTVSLRKSRTHIQMVERTGLRRALPARRPAGRAGACFRPLAAVGSNPHGAVGQRPRSKTLRKLLRLVESGTSVSPGRYYQPTPLSCSISGSFNCCSSFSVGISAPCLIYLRTGGYAIPSSPASVCRHLSRVHKRAPPSSATAASRWVST